MGQGSGEQHPNGQAGKVDAAPMEARSDSQPLTRRQAQRETAEDRAARRTPSQGTQARCLKVAVKMESAAHPVEAVQMANGTPRPVPPMRKPTWNPARRQQEAKNLQRRLKKAEKEGVILTRANRVDPNFRRRAAPGKGKGAIEAVRKYMANPENREEVNLRAQEKRKALSKAELEALRERKRLSLIRLRERKKDASKQGAHLYASWIPVYEKEMLRYH
ncbi:expressed unknown protein [Ectocarpus siliculosus]|uniref:Uncharacterized protein n=1 Tax=Ectocarpus siliculosus TaxID=2880 RepID=D7FY78_ECTSI|nr:expressed unknown protein [Ectocarpus siliculosus]|eukprot:CBJ26517.1 expressed unknown protein [Ectocarpus siliculosus]